MKKSGKAITSQGDGTKSLFELWNQYQAGVFGISESGYHYQAWLATENAEIADWLLRLTTANKR